MGYDLPTGKRERTRFKKHIKSISQWRMAKHNNCSNSIGQGDDSHSISEYDGNGSK
jgi:hypothetical protein